MEIVESLVKFLHIIVSIILIIAVLLQPGKSGDLGSMFGGGSSESVFGSAGAVPFLAKLTRILGVVFFATSLGLGYFEIRGGSSSVLKGVNAPTADFQNMDTGTVGSLDGAAIDGVAIPNTDGIDNPAIQQETIKSEEGSDEKPSENTN